MILMQFQTAQIVTGYAHSAAMETKKAVSRLQKSEGRAGTLFPSLSFVAIRTVSCILTRRSQVPFESVLTALHQWAPNWER